MCQTKKLKLNSLFDIHLSNPPKYYHIPLEPRTWAGFLLVVQPIATNVVGESLVIKSKPCTSFFTALPHPTTHFISHGVIYDSFFSHGEYFDY